MTCLNPKTTRRARPVFIQVFLSAPAQKGHETTKITRKKEEEKTIFKAQSRNMVNINAHIIMKIMKQIINQKHVNQPVINTLQTMRSEITSNTLMLRRNK